MATEALPHLVDIEQLARHLGTSERHIRRLIAERRIPHLKVGRLIRFDPVEISDWLESKRRGPDDPWRGVPRRHSL